MTAAGIILIALLSLALITAIIAGIFSSNMIMEHPLHIKDVKMVISVSGDDVVVFISGGKDAPHLREIIICIKGVQLTEDQAMQHVYSNTCVFPGVVRGITGSRDISIKGVFSDGYVSILQCTTIECN